VRLSPQETTLDDARQIVEAGVMSLSEPLPGAASMPATSSAPKLGGEAQCLGSDLRDALAAAEATRAARCAAPDVSAELGYGCVDWFIYVTDAAGGPSPWPRACED